MSARVIPDLKLNEDYKLEYSRIFIDILTEGLLWSGVLYSPLESVIALWQYTGRFLIQTLWSQTSIVYVSTSASLRYVYLSFLILSVSVLLAVDCTSVQGDRHKKSVTSQHTSWSLHFQGNFILVSRAASSVSAWFRDAEDTRRPGYQDAASRSIYQRPDSWHQEHLNNPSDPHTTP